MLTFFSHCKLYPEYIFNHTRLETPITSEQHLDVVTSQAFRLNSFGCFSSTRGRVMLFDVMLLSLPFKKTLFICQAFEFIEGVGSNVHFTI